jgi:hypothetical protein
LVSEFHRVQGEENYKSPDSDDSEWQVGDDIAEIGDAEPSAMIGKVVIGERLWNGRKKQSNECDRNGDEDQKKWSIRAWKHGRIFSG